MVLDTYPLILSNHTALGIILLQETETTQTGLSLMGAKGLTLRLAMKALWITRSGPGVLRSQASPASLTGPQTLLFSAFI